MSTFLTGFLFCFGAGVGLYTTYQFVILTNKLVVINQTKMLQAKIAELLLGNKELKFLVGELEYFKRFPKRGDGHKIERIERKISEIVTDQQIKDELLQNPCAHGGELKRSA